MSTYSSWIFTQKPIHDLDVIMIKQLISWKMLSPKVKQTSNVINCSDKKVFVFTCFYFSDSSLIIL